jgi:glycosidase
MNLHAIFHLPDSNYAYAYDKETLHIRLRTAKNDADKITLRAGDPYHWATGGGGGNLNAEGAIGWIYEEIPMIKEASTELFDFWIATVKPPFRRVRYGFMIESDSQKLFYGESGLFSLNDAGTHPVLSQLLNYFCFPFLNSADVHDTPEWAKKTVWYQIFPERFANGDASLNPKGTLKWGSCDPTWESFFGGDIQGIIDKLDYLATLGINGIYLCPIFKSPSTHKYDTEDYFEIDPQFSDKKTFKRFVDLAHEKGIKIILDIVINHCGDHFAPWQDVLENGENSKYKDWFHIRSFPVVKCEEKEMPNYDAFAFVKKMPKMKTENPDVRDYFLKVARYWTQEFNIDGWRLDVANEVDHAFWREFRKEVRSIKADSYILGEVWHDANPWLKGDQFDAVMNYPLTNAVHNFIAKNETTASEFKASISTIQTMYSRNVSEVNFNLLNSHDTERLLTTCKGDKQRVILAYTFLMTQAGSPCIYYGDEIGMEGADDPLCRKCMIWEKDLQDLELFETFKKLISLRKNYSAMRSTELAWIGVNDKENYVIFKKYDQNEEIYVILNNSDSAKTINLDTLPSKTYTDLLTNKQIDSTQHLQIKARSIALLV